MSELEHIGDKTRKFINEHRLDDVRTLALRAPKSTDIDMPFALNQIAGWQMARTKLPVWAATEGLIYPPHLSMEQCSSQQTALYKAALAERLLAECCDCDGEMNSAEVMNQHTELVDLTGGFGVDFSFMAPKFSRATYVEQQKELCMAAENNFPLLGLRHARVVNRDGIEVLESLSHATMIFLDPARRNDKGGKTVFIADCTPNVIELKDRLLQKADVVLLKLSPMLDWHKAVADLNDGGSFVREVHIVSVKNECKELLVVMQSADETGQNSGFKADLSVFCVNDGQVTRFLLKEAQAASIRLLTANVLPGAYLYEPNASLMKAGCFALLTQMFAVSALDANSHLYVSADFQAEFPGRCFRVKGVSSFNKKEMKRLLGGIGKANVAVRNFPMTVAELRKRLKLSEGGSNYIFATTLCDGSRILLLCEKV